MGIQELIVEIEREAAQRAAAELESAENRAKEMLEAAGETARGGPAASPLERRRRELEVSLARARLSARQGELEARARFLRRLEEAAKAAIEGAHLREEVRRAAPSWLAEALPAAGDGPVRVRVHPDLADAVSEVIERRPGAELVRDRSIGPGAVVEACEGRVRIDATARARLESRWPELAMELVEMVQRKERP